MPNVIQNVATTGQPFVAELFGELVAFEQRRHPAAREAIGDVRVGDPVQDLREAHFIVQFTRYLLRLLSAGPPLPGTA